MRVAALDRLQALLLALVCFSAPFHVSHLRFAAFAHLMNIVRFSAFMCSIAPLRAVPTRVVVRNSTPQHANGRYYLPLRVAVNLCV